MSGGNVSVFVEGHSWTFWLWDENLHFRIVHWLKERYVSNVHVSLGWRPWWERQKTPMRALWTWSGRKTHKRFCCSNSVLLPTLINTFCLFIRSKDDMNAYDNLVMDGTEDKVTSMWPSRSDPVVWTSSPQTQDKILFYGTKIPFNDVFLDECRLSFVVSVLSGGWSWESEFIIFFIQLISVSIKCVIIKLSILWSWWISYRSLQTAVWVLVTDQWKNDLWLIITLCRYSPIFTKNVSSGVCNSSRSASLTVHWVDPWSPDYN